MYVIRATNHLQLTKKVQNVYYGGSDDIRRGNDGEIIDYVERTPVECMVELEYITEDEANNILEELVQ